MTKTESEWSQAYRSLPPLTVRDVLVRYESRTNLKAGGYSHAQVRYFRQVLRRLTRCRTAALGTAQFRCGDCDNQRVVPVTCRNRHCASCSFVQRDNWKDDVLDWGVQCEYQHVVFTLPHLLNPWIQVYPSEFYKLLLRAVQDVLMQRHKESFGCVPGLLVFLHTWGQRMKRHVHAHVILTGGGLSLDGTRWVQVDHRSPLLSREALATAFKKMFLRRLKRQSKRWLADESNDTFNHASATKLLHELTRKTWMVNNQSPPAGKSGPEAVVNYLARYVAGVAISDSRVLSDDGTYVSFRYKNYQAGGKSVERITGQEFVQRFCMHILPKHSSRLRTVGIFHTKKRQAKLALVRHLIGGGTFEAFEQARIAAEQAAEKAAEQTAKAAAESTINQAIVSSLELKLPATNCCHHRASLDVDPEPNTAEERMAAERRHEEHLQARFDQWPKLSVDDDIRLALRAILPKPEESNKDGCDVGCVAERESVVDRSAIQPRPGSPHDRQPTNVGPPNGSRHCGPRHSSDGKRLSASVWRSRYNGCRRCGEETTKLSHWGQYDTQRIYQGVGGLLALLTMVPWKEMIIALEQLRAGRAVAHSRASAPIALPRRHDRGARATISDLDSTSNAPIAPATEEYSESTNHSKRRSTNDHTMERSQWPTEIENALDGTHYFCKIRYKAIYWYMIEMIAVRLKTAELRNPKIYEFNPDILYDPKRNKSKKTRSNERTKTNPGNGIPPPGKKHNQTAAP